MRTFPLTRAKQSDWLTMSNPNISARAREEMSISTPDLRRRLKAYSRQREAVRLAWEQQRAALFDEWMRTGIGRLPVPVYPPLVYPPLPADLAALTCGAMTRAGTPCQQKAIFKNGRCKWHGGCSTGPKTEAGKEQARINGRKGGRPRKPKP